MGKPHPHHQDLLRRLFTDLAAAEALLKEHPELVHSCDEAGETALLYAIAEAKLEAAQLLLRHKADVNARDHGGKPPLHTAAVLGNVDAVKLLLAHGAAPALQDENDDTALHYAVIAEKPSPAIIEALVHAGAPLDETNQLDETALDLALKRNLDDVAAQLRSLAEKPR